MMLVYHLKYRPQKIDELDLVEVRNSLKKILKSEVVPQSFLFSGPKGAGKTSAARIVAKVVNCLDPKDGLACNKCQNCTLINEGKAGLDIVEMDGASNRGIDDIRALKEKIYLAPVNLTGKVFVIDEVHMLTKEAFNALLKILEEPPKNVYFIMCTTNPEKIPETVLSRLVRVDFRRGTESEVAASLEKVIKGEGLDLGNDKERIVGEIFDLSEGSFRNAQKILMELTLDKGKKIDYKEWQSFCQVKFAGGSYGGEQLEKDLMSGNIKSALIEIEALAKSGVDMSLYRDRLVEYFQRKLVGIYNNDKTGLEIRQLSYLLRLLIAAGKDEKTAVMAQLPLELAIVDWGFEFGNDEGGGNDQEKDNNEKSPGTQEVDTKSVSEVETKIPEKKQTKNKEKNDIHRVEARGKIAISPDDLKEKWKQLLVAVRPYNHSVEAFLRSTRPTGIEGNKLVAEVFYKFHKERLEDERNRRIVEKGISEVFSAPLMFECRLSETKMSDVATETNGGEEELYDVAKEIFG